MNSARQARLRAMVATGSGLTSNLVIPARDKGPRPHNAYSSVLVRRDIQEGTATMNYRLADDQVRGDYAYRQLAECSVQFFRDGAVTAARNFARWLDSELGRLALEREGFGISGPIRVMELSEVIGDGWEERAAIDVTIKYIDTYHQDLGRIEEVDIALLESESDSATRLTINLTD